MRTQTKGIRPLDFLAERCDCLSKFSKKEGRGPGGGVLSLEKGTKCGPTAGERWLSRSATAKKGGAVLILYCKIGGL